MALSSQKIGVRSSAQEVQRIFTLSTTLAEMTEDFLEKYVGYSPKFVQGIRKSVSEAEKGKMKKISSFKEL